MNLRIDSGPVLFTITVVLATVIQFPALRSQEIRPYDTCNQPIRCGNDEFRYPFWGLDRPDYCGHPSFQLTCESSVPMLILDSVAYRILDIESNTYTITITRNDLWSTLCPQFLHNTTYNSTLFNGNFDQENVYLYYGCQDNVTAASGTPMADNYRFTCTVNDTQIENYFRPDGVPPIGNLLVECSNSIIVPVNRSLVPSTESDLRSALLDGFKLQWMVNTDVCDRCVRSNGRCGSNSTSPDGFACFCANGHFSRICNNTGEIGGGSKGTIRKLIIGILSSIAGIISLFLVILCRKMRLCVPPREPESENHQIEIFIQNHGRLAPRRYKYSEIKKMTNSFQDKLGHGGYGSVYKGQLPDGRLVAVKLLKEARGNGEDFINEVASISRTSHVNIVTLLGFCFEGKKRALLYEFMPNGSLDKSLCCDGSHLNWNTLFQIAKGIARGLEYLHRGCNTRIVHFDIKPHNILLDEEFIPKISDFGLAKLCKKKESIVSVMGATGTAGYMAPEVFLKSLGGASHKSDVYSYGMMVLEMTGTSKNNNSNMTSTSEAYFPDWIYKQLEVGGNIGDETVEVEELARKMMMVSLWCIQFNPSDRPSISKVVEMLEGSIESLQVPPRRFESSSARPFQGNLALSTQSSSDERVSTVHEKISQPNTPRSR
ncbi:hypothetical protein R6Q59_029259 [Mikania micrantha]